jgi:hypothetical protein
VALLSAARRGLGPRAALAAVAVVCLLAAPARAQIDEREVMAAFLFNFLKFVTWPEESFPSPDAPIQIAVLRDEAFRDIVDELAGDKVVGGRALRVTTVSSPAEARSAQLLFVPADQTPAPEFLAELRGSHVLTVADAENFAQEGGMVGFVREDNRLRFEINESAARRAGLAVSSRLLRLATKVR